MGKALLLLLQQLVLVPACLGPAWSGGSLRAQWHLRTFMMLKVGAKFTAACASIHLVFCGIITHRPCSAHHVPPPPLHPKTSMPLPPAACNHRRSPAGRWARCSCAAASRRARTLRAAGGSGSCSSQRLTRPT